MLAGGGATILAVGHTRIGPVSFSQWDASWYTWLAGHGYSFGHGSLYQRGSAVYFPALPALIWLVRPLLGGSALAAGMLVAAAATASAARSLYRYTAATRGDRAARLAVWLLCTNPYAFVLFTPFTEPLLLACAIPALDAGRQGRWRTAGLLAAAASLVRITGLFVAAAVVVQYVLAARRRPDTSGRRPELMSAVWLLTPGVTFGAWTAYLHHLSGRWDTYTYLERAIWHRQAATPWYGLVHTLHLAALRPASGPEITAEIVALAGLIATAVWLGWRRRWAELAYVGGPTVLLACSNFYSANQRGLLVAFPVYVLAGAALAQRPGLARPLLACSAAAAVAMSCVYVTGLRFTG